MHNKPWCLLTAYDSNFSEVAAKTIPAMQKYAEQFGFDFAEHIDTPLDFSPSWAKIVLAKQKFSEGHEGVFWLDADALLRRYDEDIRIHLRDDRDFYFVKEAHPIPGTPSQARLNSGVWMMRNTPLASRFLETCLARGNIEGDEWWDQAAMIETFGFHSMFPRPPAHKPDKPTEYAARLHWLPTRWNNCMGFDAEPNAIVHHFIGAGMRGKLAFIEMDEAFDRLQPRDAAAEQLFRDIIRAGFPLAWRRVMYGQKYDIDGLQWLASHFDEKRAEAVAEIEQIKSQLAEKGGRLAEMEKALAEADAKIARARSSWLGRWFLDRSNS